MASKYDKERDRALNRAKGEYLKSTPASRMGLPIVPPPPGSPGTEDYLAKLKRGEMADATPGQKTRNDEIKRSSFKGLAKSESTGGKKDALKKKIAQFRAGGKLGGKMLGPLGYLSTLDEAGKIMQGKRPRRID